ncbi:MAG: glycosyltransferase [Schleiferiaceae bacterium]|nr:glycosyltransferase [Schleiferiaceae bacterium]
MKRKDAAPKTSGYSPSVAVIFAAYNEESVLKEKIDSLLASSYPEDLLKIYVGSDASTDDTDVIAQKYADENSRVRFIRFDERTGKSGIINHLVSICEENLIIGTDANIIFNRDTVNHFVRHFEDNEVQMVGGNIAYFQKDNAGIAKQENAYLSFENKLKQGESDLWQKVQGVEGGLYCIRKTAFVPIPPLTFMEDFYVTCAVLKNNGKVLFDKHAMGFEDVSTLQEEEFKRKTRISIGNFQNLSRFKGLLWKEPYPLGFAFFSHKILRWFTPFLAIASMIAAFILHNHLFYLNYLYLVICVLLLTILDGLLYSLQIKSGPLRFVGHFVMMNLALLNGYIKYLKGVRTNVWQPTKRNQ